MNRWREQYAADEVKWKTFARWSGLEDLATKEIPFEQIVAWAEELTELLAN